MKIISILVLLVTFCGGLSAQEKSVSLGESQDQDYLAELKEELVLVWPKNRTINIVFHGHSVPSGYFRSPKVNTLAAYPHLFLEFLKENYQSAVVNCITTSIGGEQSEQGAMRFKEEVLTMRPDLLFIDYALNDRSIGLDRTEAAWRSMIKDALVANVKLVLVTPTPDLSEDILDDNATLAGYVSLIKNLGAEFNLPVVDSYGQFKALKKSGVDISTYMSQGNHPNELGHKVVLKALSEELFNEL